MSNPIIMILHGTNIAYFYNKITYAHYTVFLLIVTKLKIIKTMNNIVLIVYMMKN